MSKINNIVEQFKKPKLTLQQRIHLALDFKRELQKYESGDLKDFKNTAIYGCYTHYFNTFCSDLVRYL